MARCWLTLENNWRNTKYNYIKVQEGMNMSRGKHGHGEEYLLEQLREIILREDREELEQLKNILENPQLLSEHITPIIEQNLEFFKQNFPREFELAVERIFELKMKRSQSEIINVIYPKLGKLIKKYIAHEFQMLKERVDRQLKKSLIGRIRAWFKPAPKPEEILANLSRSSVDEIYIIQRDSGLLIASASAKEMIDKELIAGMLTAIKAFVEDAFKRGEEELEMIQYGTYQILIQNFYDFYIALAIDGTMSFDQRKKLSERILDFADKELNKDLSDVDPYFRHELKVNLTNQFIYPQN